MIGSAGGGADKGAAELREWRGGSPPPTGGTEGACPGASFPFLGFTHYWGLSRGGNWIVKRKPPPTGSPEHCGQCPRGVGATGTRRCESNEQPFGASYWVTMGITASQAMGVRWGTSTTR